MRIQVLSDLHLEFPQPDYELHDVGADVLVLAGDIHNGPRGIEWAAHAAVSKHRLPAVYVPGNHEYYNSDYFDTAREMRQSALANDIHLLDGDVVVIDGVRFLGTPLWSDFELLGDSDTAKQVAARKLNDFRLIQQRARRFSPDQSIALHLAARRWLEDWLAKPFDGPTVVVSHHAPHPNSVPERYRGNSLSPAFVSNLTVLIERHQPSVWIHGHLHDSLDYWVGGTRIVCNPRGYHPGLLNPAFDPGFVVEV